MWFDPAVVESFVESTPLWAAFLFLAISYLGSIYVIAPATALMYLRADDWRTATWLGIVLCAYALFVFLKPVAGTERPGVESPIPHEQLPILLEQIHLLAVDFDTDSFPSGHAVAATVFYGLLVVDLDVGTTAQRLVGATLILLGIYTSRIVLGVHFLGDVVGGAMLGVALLIVLLFLRELVSNPVETLLGIAAVLAVVSIVLGRPLDGIGLLVAIGITSVAHRKFDLHGRGLQGLLGSGRTSES